MCGSTMPQIRASRRVGLAIDHDMTKNPAPVYINTKTNISREYRAQCPDHSNMILSENRPDNRLDDSKWTGNAFAGNFQFVKCIGTGPLRPGIKLERDIQSSTLANENARLLNTTMMGRAEVLFSSMPTEEAKRSHQQAIHSMQSLRRHAEGHEKAENPHAHVRNELELSLQRQHRLDDHQQAMQGLRTAGLACINPRMGTCGSHPDLTGTRGRSGMQLWRESTPFAIDPACDAPAAWPRQGAFGHPT